MAKGRKPQYELNENIVEVAIRSGSRYGRCVKCEKPVKARNWHKHTHQDWQKNISLSLNKACLDEIKTLCCSTVDEEGQDFLNTVFPQGINGFTKETYIANIRKMFLMSLTTDPRGNIDHQSINEQEAMEPSQQFDQEMEDMSQQLEPEIVEEKQIKDKAIQSFEIPKEEVLIERVYKNKAQQEALQDFLQDLFVQVKYEVSLEGIRLKSLINLYCCKKEKPLVLSQAFHPSRVKDHSLLFILKQCFICQTSICETSGSFRQCIFCRTRIHNKCMEKIEKCFCSTTKVPPTMGKSDIFEEMFQEPEKMQQQKILSYYPQNIKHFSPRTPLKKIAQAEDVIKKAINKRSLYYNLTAVVCSGKGYQSKTSALNDPFLTIPDLELVQIYQKYKEEQYKAPVQLLQISKDEYGIQAMEDIPAYSFICEYACDILPMTCIQHLKYKDHVMCYANGKTSKQELILAPYICSNWGPLINHDDEGNCASLRTVIDRRIRVLLYSKKKIYKGQQLLYNYNADWQEIRTQNFRDFKK